MKLELKRLYLRNFRNFAKSDVSFAPQINVFMGRNAQGKTNLLEAISVISTGRSFRTQHLSDLIQDGASFFFLEAVILKEGISQTIRLTFDGQSKKAECNATRHFSFQPLLGFIPSVLFTPPDIDLVNGPPASRRRFLNLHLAQSDPLYIHHLLRYWRAMRQRNALLRLNQLAGIECWEQEMASSAAYLGLKRKLLLEDLNERLKRFCPLLAAEEAHVRYSPSFNDDFLAQLSKNRPREQQLALTMAGPHRDDFSVLIGQKPARLYASDGQKRTAIAALRLAQWEHLSLQIDALPVFGVDDLELHLDPERQKTFCLSLEKLGQVFVTTPGAAIEWPSACRHSILNGQVSPVQQP